MKKKLIKLTLIVGVALLFGTLISKIYLKIEDKKIVESNISYFHNLPFVGLDSSFVELEKETPIPIVLILFNSECSICFHEAEQLHSQVKKFENSQVLMVSTESLQEIRKFAHETKLQGYVQIVFAHLPPEIAYSYFGNYPVPSIFIYDEYKKLVKKFAGETKVETLLKCLNIQ